MLQKLSLLFRRKSKNEKKIRHIKSSLNEEKARHIKSLFLLYFDGSYGIDAAEKVYSTFTMGVCKLEFKKNVLTVHLRRPGLLIGRRGKTIDRLAKALDCEIDIVEVNLIK